MKYCIYLVIRDKSKKLAIIKNKSCLGFDLKSVFKDLLNRKLRISCLISKFNRAKLVMDGSLIIHKKETVKTFFMKKVIYIL